MQHQDEMVRCLVDCDVPGIRKLWKHVAPHEPEPKTDMDCLISIHMARTVSKSLSNRLRFYSHRWLTDNGHPSQLPDNLKPKAERMYPAASQGSVGIACRTFNPIMLPVVAHVQESMEHAVLDCYANGDRDPVVVKQQIMEARTKTLKKLTGIFLSSVGKVR